MRAMTVILAVALVLGIASAAQAAQIGINFAFSGTGGSGSTSLGSAETAGAPTYAQAEWNNLTIPSVVQPPIGTSWASLLDTSSQTLNDDSGTGTSLYVEYSPGGAWYSSWNPVATGQQNTVNGRLLKSGTSRYNYVAAEINISNIPYSEYSLVVYYGSGSSGGAFYEESAGRVTLTDGVNPIDDIAVKHPAFNNNGQFTGTFVEANPLTPGVWSTHAVFTGLTDAAIVLGMTSADTPVYTGNRVDEDGPGISGFQIINTAIPEPATMSLLALGGLGVLIRRKKK